MKVKDLIKGLKGLNPNTSIYVANDAEWNIIYGRVNMELIVKKGVILLYGLDGSEVDNEELIEQK